MYMSLQVYAWRFNRLYAFGRGSQIPLGINCIDAVTEYIIGIFMPLTKLVDPMITMQVSKATSIPQSKVSQIMKLDQMKHVAS